MRKIIFYTAIVFFLFIISIHCSAQRETFDIVTYSPPKEWKKDVKKGVVNYTKVNTAAGKFCIVTMYASTVSAGDAETDFKREWKELVITPYQAEENPPTEKHTTTDGWNAIVGATLVKVDDADVYIILTVFSGFGKTFTVRSSLNDQSYTAQIDALFETMELDKTKTSGMKNNDITPTNNIDISTTKGGSGKFGLMMYSTPAGWSEQIFGDGVVFKPLDLPAGEHVAMQIMQPLDASGTLESALVQSFEEATTMYNTTSMYQADGKYGKNAAQKSFNGWDYIRGKGGVKTSDGSELGLELFVIKINNRFERVAILESRKYCGGVSRYYATDRIRYRDAIETLLYSLQFSDFDATPLQPGSINGSGIAGVWEGTIQSTGTGNGVRLEVFKPIFFTNGQVYFGPKFPTEGLHELDSRILPELHPRDWGTYTFSNGKGILNMPFAEIPIRTEGDKLIVTKNQRDWPLYKINSVDDATFNGTYTMSESNGERPIITFTPDGKFTDNGAIRNLFHDGNTCVNPGFIPGSGTYEVKDFTVTFNYNDKRKVKIAFLGTGYDKSKTGPPTLRMSFNDDPMNRQ